MREPIRPEVDRLFSAGVEDGKRRKKSNWIARKIIRSLCSIVLTVALLAVCVMGFAYVLEQKELSRAMELLGEAIARYRKEQMGV